MVKGITRRDLLRIGAPAGAAAFVSGRWFSGHVRGLAGPGIAAWQTQNLRKWVDPLPIMPVAVPPVLGGGTEIDDPFQPGGKADFYAMECRQTEWQFHSDLPPAQANSYWYGGAELQYAGVGASISILAASATFTRGFSMPNIRAAAKAPSIRSRSRSASLPGWRAPVVSHTPGENRQARAGSHSGKTH